jgi:hypothetical protein
MAHRGGYQDDWAPAAGPQVRRQVDALHSVKTGSGASGGARQAVMEVEPWGRRPDEDAGKLAARAQDGLERALGERPQSSQ